MESEKPIHVKAIHVYNPVNNDELKLEKGDIITVTQKDDGGWWEGTLDGRTGWFPSNYVTIVELDDINSSTAGGNPIQIHEVSSSPSKSGSGPGSVISSPVKRTNLPATAAGTAVAAVADGSSSLPIEEQIKYRRMILRDLIHTEEKFVHELENLLEKYLQPLTTRSGIFISTDAKILMSNLVPLLQAHKSSILTNIKSDELKPVKEQRIGKIFLENAPKLENLHKTYAENHPKVVGTLEKYKEPIEKFLLSDTSVGPDGLGSLLTILSLPFRRLERYPILLQELERHVEYSHKDRGDLQRSIEYYKQIDITCCTLRKQKDMEYDLLTTSIVGWEGNDISSLGEIIYMSPVNLGPESHTRYLVLFPNTLVILSYDKNVWTYEGKLPISGITLSSQNCDKENKKPLSTCFEISGPMIEPISITCPTKSSKDTWILHLSKLLKMNRFPSFGTSPGQSYGQLTPPSQAWSIERLRPTPPFNPFLTECLAAYPSSPTGGSGKTHSTIPAQVTSEEDLTILSIVDAFCSKNRQLSAKSSENQGPVQPPKPKTDLGPRSSGNITDMVYDMRDDISFLKTTLMKVSKQLEEEQVARKSLQSVLLQSQSNSIGSDKSTTSGNQT